MLRQTTANVFPALNFCKGNQTNPVLLMMTHRAVSRWHRPQSWGDTLGRPSMRKAAHCGEHSSCILCLLSCMPPSSSRPCLVLPLHHSQVALAQPAVLGGCRPAWGDAVHGRPPASHLNSAVWHAAGFSSYVCRARRTSEQDVCDEAENRHPWSRQTHWQTHWLCVSSYTSTGGSTSASFTRFVLRPRYSFDPLYHRPNASSTG